MAGVLSRHVDDPVLVPKKVPGILSRIAAMPNPGYLVSQGVDRITTPGYPVDDALRGYMGRAPAFQPTLGQAASAWRDEGLGQTSEFLTALQRGDLDAVMNSSLFPMGAMTAYHGSPHKFDAFDLSKIGTGEGAQAYGHGLYFAESQDVAKSYQSALSSDRGFSFKGKTGLTRSEVQDMVNAEVGAKYLDGITRGSGVADSVMDDMVLGTQRRPGQLPRQYKAGSERAALYERLKSEIHHADPGNLYHVDIPDDEIAKMLDWDKPLSEQPESVRKALNDAIGRDLTNESGWQKLKGEKLYNAVVERAGVADKGASASARLRELGIPGIKYLDGGSRGAGEGTRNLVLFDDKIPKIIKRE